MKKRELEERLRAHREQMLSVLGAVEQLEARLEKLEGGAFELNRRLPQVEGDMRGTQSKVAELKGIVGEELPRLFTRIEELERVRIELEAARVRLEARLEKLEGRADSAEANIAGHERDLGKAGLILEGDKARQPETQGDFVQGTGWNKDKARQPGRPESHYGGWYPSRTVKCDCEKPEPDEPMADMPETGPSTKTGGSEEPPASNHFADQSILLDDLLDHIADVWGECQRHSGTQWERSLWDRIVQGDPEDFVKLENELKDRTPNCWTCGGSGIIPTYATSGANWDCPDCGELRRVCRERDGWKDSFEVAAAERDQARAERDEYKLAAEAEAQLADEFKAERDDLVMKGSMTEAQLADAWTERDDLIRNMEDFTNEIARLQDIEAERNQLREEVRLLKSERDEARTARDGVKQYWDRKYAATRDMCAEYRSGRDRLREGIEGLARGYALMGKQVAPCEEVTADLRALLDGDDE